MKISIFFLFVMLLTASAYPQITKLSINLEDVNIQEFIDAIENQSDYIFLLRDCMIV